MDNGWKEIDRNPSFGMRALMGDMADEALLSSQHAEPARLREIGHVFHHPALAAAVRDG